MLPHVGLGILELNEEDLRTDFVVKWEVYVDTSNGNRDVRLGNVFGLCLQNLREEYVHEFLVG